METGRHAQMYWEVVVNGEQVRECSWQVGPPGRSVQEEGGRVEGHTGRLSFWG